MKNRFLIIFERKNADGLVFASMRKLMKIALRAYGFKCTWAEWKVVDDADDISEYMKRRKAQKQGAQSGQMGEPKREAA